jgi:hypothetical protein
MNLQYANERLEELAKKYPDGTEPRDYSEQDKQKFRRIVAWLTAYYDKQDELNRRFESAVF